MSPVEAIGFHDRIETFYRRLVQRRLNALDTFNDPVLRDFFRTPDLFFDYYADLAQALSAAHFEKSRAVDYEIQEFLFEDPEWELSEGSWWITPGKL